MYFFFEGFPNICRNKETLVVRVPTDDYVCSCVLMPIQHPSGEFFNNRNKNADNSRKMRHKISRKVSTNKISIW